LESAPSAWRPPRCGTTCHCTFTPSVTPIHSSGDSKLICSANFMTWPIPAILCRPSYFIVLHFIVGLVSSAVSRPCLTLSLSLSLSLAPNDLVRSVHTHHRHLIKVKIWQSYCQKSNAARFSVPRCITDIV